MITYWVHLLTGSFLGLNNFGIIMVPEVLELLATCSAGVLAYCGVAVVPLAGAHCANGAGLVIGGGDEFRPRFSGLGLEIEEKCRQKSRTNVLDNESITITRPQTCRLYPSMKTCTCATSATEPGDRLSQCFLGQSVFDCHHRHLLLIHFRH